MKKKQVEKLSSPVLLHMYLYAAILKKGVNSKSASRQASSLVRQFQLEYNTLPEAPGVRVILRLTNIQKILNILELDGTVTVMFNYDGNSVTVQTKFEDVGLIRMLLMQQIGLDNRPKLARRMKQYIVSMNPNLKNKSSELNALVQGEVNRVLKHDTLWLQILATLFNASFDMALSTKLGTIPLLKS